MSSIYITINQDRFSLYKSDEAFRNRASALTTLNRIEEVIFRKLLYVSLGGLYPHISQTELFNLLRKEAALIRDFYSGRKIVTQVFDFETRKKFELVYKNIEALAPPVCMMGLSKDLFQYICGFLEIADLERLAKVNRYASQAVKEVKILRAREYGYKGHDVDQAKEYWKSLIQVARKALKDKSIPEAYRGYHKKRFFFRPVNLESTIRKIKQAGFEHEPVLKVYLARELFLVAEAGDIKKARALLALRADPKARTLTGQTILHGVKLDKDLVSLFLELGVDPNIVDNNGFVVLCREDMTDPEIAQLFYKHGANLDLQNRIGYTILHCAANRGAVDLVRTLLRLKADPNSKSRTGCTPLKVAKWDKSLISLLLEHGADPNITTNNRNVILCNNVSDPEITELLCRYGAKVNLQNSLGYAALHYAASNRNIKTARVLLRFGANPDLRSRNGSTPRKIAQNNEELASIFRNLTLANGASGSLPPHLAE